MTILSKAAQTEIRVASFNLGGAFETAVAVVQKHYAVCKDADAVRRFVLEGRVALKLGKATAETFVKAAKIVDKANVDATSTTKAKRTREEQDWFNAAAMQWSRLSRAAGIVRVNEKRGKKAGSKAKAGKTKAAPKAKAVVKLGTAKDATQAAQQVRNMALMLSTYCAKNKDVISPELSAIVATFVADVNKNA